METLWSDVRLASRSLLKSSSFTVICVLTLALGIGANTAIFSVVNAVLLRPLPYQDPETIVTLWQRNFATGNEREEVSPANFLDWRERSRSFSNMAILEPWALDLVGEGRPESIPSIKVSAGFFEVLGSQPLLGRVFRGDDYQSGRNLVVILDYYIWKERFGSDPRILGRVMNLDKQPHEVVGVMPPEFSVTSQLYDIGERESRPLMWSPRSFDEEDRTSRKAQRFQVLARLRPGVPVEQAQAEMDSIAGALAREYPEANRTMGATVLPLRERVVGGVRRLLLILSGAVGLVLLIACANIANLLLARATTRERELAVRAAMGAGRWRLARLLLAEGLILALTGGLAGVLLAVAGTELLVALAPPTLLRLDQLRIDLSVMLFALGASFVAALLFSGFPAFHFSHAAIEARLRNAESRGTTSGHVRAFRSTVVAAEISLALILVTGTGLLARSFYSLLQVHPGFRTEKLLLVQLFIWDRYETPEKRVNFFHQATDRIRAIPGVSQVGVASAVPFAPVSIDFDVSFQIPGRPTARPEDEPAAFFAVANENYFQTMGIPVKRGRPFGSSDDVGGKPVVIISEALARRYWPNADPVGQEIEPRYGSKPVRREIVGVVGDVRHTGLDAEPRLQMFIPYSQSGSGSMTLVIRASTDPALVTKPVQETIWEINPTLPIYSTDSMSTLLADSLEQRRFVLLLLGSFSLVAIVLAAVGIYGVITYTTTQRTREIGIRSALGATRGNVLTLILRDGFAIAIFGVALGMIGALALTRSLRGMLFEVGATDPLTFGLTAILLICVALTATYLPARRAAAVDPAVALRYE